MIDTLKTWWAASGTFRIAVFTFVAPQLAVPLTQIAAWAGTQGATPLPNWHMTLVVLGYSTTSAIVGWILKKLQLQKSFPTLKK